MSNRVDVQVRNINLSDKIRDYVTKKAGNLDHYLPLIEEAFVELTYHKAARIAEDRNVAQVTIRGKGLVLRTEERADDILAAFDVAMDNMQRQIERYKGKHYHGRGEVQIEEDQLQEASAAFDENEQTSRIARRKKFTILPMTEEEAIEEMNLLGHNNFFIFYNGNTNKINVLYRRRDGYFGLIEPEVG